MTAAEILWVLSEAGADLSACKGRLRVVAPRGVLNPALKQALSERKRELLALISAGNWQLDRQQPGAATIH